MVVKNRISGTQW